MISPDALIGDIVTQHPGAEKVFGAHGLPCAGCHVSTRESIRGGAAVHHLDLAALLSDLEAYIRDGSVPPPRQKPAAKTPPPERQRKPGIEHVVAIMSGKGGVGKSVVTALLGVALRRRGYSVGILDADITGPSQAKLFGVTARPYQGADDKPHPPASRLGIQIMSMNLILPDEREA